MPHSRRRKLYLTAALALASAATLGLGGCFGTFGPLREDVADRIAHPVWMLKRSIQADPFALTTYERVHQRGGEVDLYIEGDGFATPPLDVLASDKDPVFDPTPDNPVALHMASKDTAPNVIYIARPCQYSGMIDKDKTCPAKYSAGASFAPEVIKAYDAALSELKARWGISKFNLIGYGGGGGIAALVAAQRDDIATLRTVAGTLDTESYARINKLPPYSESLNPASVALKIRDLPQVHFVGGADDVNPPEVLQAFLQAQGHSQCTSYKMIQEAEHAVGWVDKWPELMAEKPACKGPPMMDTDFIPYEEPPLEKVFRTVRELPAKP